MRSLVAVTALAGALALAAPAQADITASVITTPKDPHYVLAKSAGTSIDIAGHATGTGDVTIVCDRYPAPIVLAPDVPVANDGTFAADDVSVDPLTTRGPGSVAGRTCRLRALPAGNPVSATEPFRGPVLAVSTYAEEPVVFGANSGMLGTFSVWASGIDRTTVVGGSFGACGLTSMLLDPTYSAVDGGLSCTGSPAQRPAPPTWGVAIDLAPVQTAAALWPANTGMPGFPQLTVPSLEFNESTGELAVTERNRLAKCGPGGAFPVTPASCTALDPVPVQHERTTTVLPGDQVVRVVDRWSSTDGHPHRLDLVLEAHTNLPASSMFRFPGEVSYSQHEAPDLITRLPAGAPVLVRNADVAQPGSVVLPLQAADSARFFAPGEFDLVYARRTIPAAGTLTFTHYYVTTRRSDEVEPTAARLLASLTPAQPAPHGGGGGGGGHIVTLPRFSRAGKLHVRRAGRTFRVTTRDRVTCPAACTVHVSGRRIVATDLHLAAGERAAVRFRLTRAGARKLRHAGRLRLRLTLTAGTAAAQRTVRVRLPRTGTS
ncbi:MAG TPA: hypothetical protein VFX51_28835 [Solirubrobacteraceae bacterium]|nr:hypothetical protein [Solirubrobacteraceae bacterium]